MQIIIFLMVCSMVITSAVGAVAYLAIIEAQKCRHEMARMYAELIRMHEVAKPMPPVNPVTDKPFAVIVGRALANYDAEQRARAA